MQWLRKITFPIAMLYAGVVYLRNWLYDVGVFKSVSFDTPTICVGNLSVGGTGKTPMVDFLVKGLKENHKVAMLSRGYRRKSNGFQWADEKTTVDVLGDEPYQLYKKHPELTVAVDADRINGIKRIESLIHSEVVLLDDAFQHRRVQPSFSVLLTTYKNSYPNDHYLPMGSLRDAKNQAKRADVIIVTKCPEDLSTQKRGEFEQLIRPKGNQALLFSYLAYDNKFIGEKESLTYSDVMGKDIAVVTGIADPQLFIGHLAKNSLKFTHYNYADHHYFSAKELDVFKKHRVVLTTEKDFVRLVGKLPHVYYLGIEHKFLFGGEKRLSELLGQKLKLLFQPWH